MGSQDLIFLCQARLLRKHRVEKVTQKDFYFLLTLTELNGGTGVWFGRELITKQGSGERLAFNPDLSIWAQILGPFGLP